MKTSIAQIDVDGAPHAFIRDDRTNRFELAFDSGTAFIDFRQREGVLSLVHTEVPASLRGKGVGESLTAAVLDYVRSQGWSVKPFCKFVAKYIARHKQYADLVDPSFNSQDTAG